MEKEEQYLVSEIFRVFTSPENQALVQKVDSATSDFVYLHGIAAQLRTEPQPFFFSRKPQMIENVLLERLAVPKTPIFGYLTRCWFKASEERSHYSNTNNGLLKVAEESLEIIKNYILLAVTTPEMFEGANFEVRTSFFSQVNFPGNPTLDKAKQMLYLILEIGQDSFIADLFEGLSDEPNLLFTICMIFATELRALIVFNSEAQTLLDLFITLCSNKTFKAFIIDNFVKSVVKNGLEFEMKPIISLFFGKSILPYQGDPLIKEFEFRALDRIKSCKTKNAYMKTCDVKLLEFIGSDQKVQEFFDSNVEGDDEE